MTTVPYVINDWPLVPITRRGLEVVCRVDVDQSSWALMNLGQYVQGTHEGRPVRAYVYSLAADKVNGNLLTLLIERPS